MLRVTVLLLLLIPSFCRAGADPDAPPTAPIVGQPTNFSGAIGSFTIVMYATPTTLQAEDPLLLTVRITGRGSLKQIQRPDLRRLPKFQKSFQITDLGDRTLPAERAREFDYRLRPRDATVKQIPALPFVYFKPGFIPDYKGYQTTYARPISLQVQPRAAVQPPQVQGQKAPATFSDEVYDLATGPAVLERWQPFSLPGPGTCLALILLPPLGCVVWLVVWRRCHPDHVRQLRRRQSRAAVEAFQALRRLDKLPQRAQVEEAGRIITTYLQQRLDLRIVQPTPQEITAHLERLGASGQQAERCAKFFAAWDAACFGPEDALESTRWDQVAGELVRHLEEEPWSSHAA
jgi:hypothetical protein